MGVFPGDRTPEGIMDLAGNVLEWCLDAWCDDFSAQCKGQALVADPLAQGEDGSPRVLRGGSFAYQARFLRASFRIRDVPVFRDWGIGFRCALAPSRQH